MAQHLMVDLETLDTLYSSTILTIGAVKFDPFTDEPMTEFYLRVDIDSQEKLKCTISNSTIEWWSQQDKAVQEEAFNPENRVSIEDAIAQFHKFAWGSSKFWSHGSCFDLVILEYIFHQLGRVPPWNFWEVRDTRTLFEIAEPDMPQDLKHNALEDAKRQAIGVRNSYRKLQFEGKTFP